MTVSLSETLSETLCVSMSVTGTVHDMSNMSNYVDPWDMQNNFCFHVYAQKSLFIGENIYF